MTVFWTREAEPDRLAIWDYLEARDPTAAMRIDRLFGEAAARLAEFPLLGHPARSTVPENSIRIAAIG